MALKASIFKLELNIADMDRHYYQSHEITIARHPSENDHRMMLRILLFAKHAHENLNFTKGLCVNDEPDIWCKNATDEIEAWIELGQPDEKRLRKACGKSEEVYVYPYHTKSAVVWWKQMESKLKRFENLHVIHIPEVETTDLSNLVKRNMVLQCTIQDGEMWFSDEQYSLHVKPEVWK